MKFKKFLQKIKDKFEIKRQAIYLSDEVEITENIGKEKIDIVISPKFYWIKKEELKIANEKEAINFANSVFEGQIPDDELINYRFLATKFSDEYFIFIAYNPREILAKIEEFNIPLNKIGKIYTSQTEFKELDNSLNINSQKQLIILDGIVSEFPQSYKNDNLTVQEFLNQTSRTKYNLDLSGIFNENNISTPLLLSIPIALSIYLIGNIVALNKSINNIDSEIEKRKEQYKLPATSFQIQSIKDRYQKIEAEQNRLRSYLLWLQIKKFNKYGKIKYLNLTKRGLEFKLKLKNKKVVNDVKMILQKKDKNVFFEQDDDILEVSFKNE